MRLFELLREDDGGPWATTEVYDVADEIDVSDKTIRNYLDSLTDAGALTKTSGERATDPNQYHLK